VSESHADDLARRQNYHLGQMMAADSQRIDGLVDDVGIVKGRVESVHSKVEAIDRNIDKLSDAMAGLVRYELKLEHQDQTAAAMLAVQRSTDTRVTDLERRIGPLEETRTWAVQAMRIVLGLVLVALVGLVLVKGTP
jgi:polyhydroxyalkanoate synthesis regulator phasin